MKGIEMNDLLYRIQDEMVNLTQTQKTIADYILTNYHDIPFLTITNIAQAVGVSDKSIINFCSYLGFENFSSFKNVFVNHVKTELAIYDNFKSRIEDLEEHDTLIKTMLADKTNIELTLSKQSNIDSIKPFLSELDNASNIYICGFRSSSILMDFFVQSLRIQGYKIVPFTFEGHFVDQLCQIKSDDLFILFTFSRYTSIAVKALNFLKSRNIKIISFTDSILSPAFRLADVSFICETQSFTHQASYVGVLSLLNLLLIENTMINKKKAISNLARLQEALDYFDTFDDSDK